MKRFVVSCAVCLVLFGLATELYADQKVKKRMSVSGQSFDTTTYIKGQRSRDEMNFGQFQMITIKQCDLNQTISVNDRTKTYMVTKTNLAAPKAAAAAKGAPTKQEVFEEEDAAPEGARKGGVVTIDTSVQDTGERKDFFGYEARHLKTSMKMQSSADACTPNQSMNMSTDGWYITFKEKAQTCERPQFSPSESPMRRQEPSCVDRHRFTGAGVMSMFNAGYPVDVTTTIVDDKGKTTSMRQQALELSSATLDASLFDAPAGYRQASSYSDMMGMGNIGAMMANAGRERATRSAPPTPESRRAAATPGARGTNVKRHFAGTREIGPKQPGKMRVGVVAFDDPSGKVTDSDNLRRMLMDDIEKFGYEAVPVDSRGQSAAMNDCKEMECDYIVFNGLKPGSAPSAKKIGGMFGKALSGNLAGAAAQGADTSGPFQGTVDYRLFKVVANDPSLTGTQEAKGGSGGASAMDKEAKDVAKQIAKGQ